MESYIEDKKKLYMSIHDFLDNSQDENEPENFTRITNLVKSQGIEENREEMLQFLRIIKSIGNNHHRDQYFNEKIEQIFLCYKTQIKQTLSNDEIFHIFENNKKIVLFLLKNDIIKMTESIYREMISKIEPNGIHYWHFFIPEIENLIGKDKMKFVKRELLSKNSRFFDNFDAKRQEGENDSFICSMIREDLIEEFISYMNRHDISHSSYIVPSVFETNPFLNDNMKITLIEYSAFFGSIQIFEYLFKHKAKVNPSIWLYAIHSKNAELISILEDNKINPPKKSYENCFIESIKCHHNDIAEYIGINFLFDYQKKLKEMDEIISNWIKYYNYSYFQIGSIINHGFFHLSFYHYDKLFELLMKENKSVIESKIISIFQYFNQEMI